jgi:hypothetical protein
MNQGEEPAGAITFRVAVLFEQAHGFAWLRIEPGRLAVVVGRLTRLGVPRGRLVQRDDGRVTVYAAMIGFPPFLQSTGLVLRPDDNEPVLAMLPHWRRRQLLSALEQADFELDLRRTMFGAGQRAVARY